MQFLRLKYLSLIFMSFSMVFSSIRNKTIYETNFTSKTTTKTSSIKHMQDLTTTVETNLGDDKTSKTKSKKIDNILKHFESLSSNSLKINNKLFEYCKNCNGEYCKKICQKVENKLNKMNTF